MLYTRNKNGTASAGVAAAVTVAMALLLLLILLPLLILLLLPTSSTKQAIPPQDLGVGLHPHFPAALAPRWWSS